jgi:hypothetical protein
MELIWIDDDIEKAPKAVGAIPFSNECKGVM